jgi:hypothetical protein
VDRFILMAVSVLGFVGIAGCSQQKPVPPLHNLNVQITLDQPVAKIEGVAWPTTNRQLDDIQVIDADADITIHFPSGLRYSTFSRATFLSQRDGVVWNVTLTPLAETVSFEKALARVKAITKELGVEKNDLVAGKLRSYKANPPKWEDMQSKPLGCEMEKGISLFIEIKPHWSEPDKWFLSCDFSVSR